MLNAIVFVCGAALMALEIVAARVLAPALGNSIFVWGSVISTVMVALSVGYWAGGHVADRFGASRTLAPVIAAGGLLTVIAPLVAKVTLPWAANLGPRLGSLAAATLIFFAPALFLAMVSPLGVRLASSRGIEHIGRSAGGLYAISTGGSIVGTLATSFWLIPLLSLDPLIVAIGFLLFATSLVALYLPVYYQEPEASGAAEASARLTRLSLATSLALVVAGGLIGSFVLVKVAPPPAINELGERILLRKDSEYHRITVTEDATIRHLRFDKSNQSAMDLSDPYRSRIAYPDYLHLAVAFHPDPARVLVLGLGGGMVSKRYWRDYPGASVDSVEIDPAVVDVAQRYFALPTDPRLRIFTQDGRRYVQTTNEHYDIAIVDAYYADSLPFHLATSEFFGELKSKMTSDGVVAYNVISSAEGDDSRLFRSLYQTAAGVWRHVWVFPIGLGSDRIATERRNIIMLASDQALTREELLRRIASKVDGRVSIDGFAGFGADLYTGTVRMGDVPALTDQHAPTDDLIRVQ
jgi:spermidine synthase